MRKKPLFHSEVFMPDNASVESENRFNKIQKEFDHIFEANQKKHGVTDNLENTKLIVYNSKFLSKRKEV
jgi:hypothetical protein